MFYQLFGFPKSSWYLLIICIIFFNPRGSLLIRLGPKVQLSASVGLKLETFQCRFAVLFHCVTLLFHCATLSLSLACTEVFFRDLGQWSFLTIWMLLLFSTRFCYYFPCSLCWGWKFRFLTFLQCFYWMVLFL